MRILMMILVLVLSTHGASAQIQTEAQTETETEKAQLLADRAAVTVETLKPLIQTRRTLSEQIRDLVARIEAAADAEKAPLEEELQLLNQELSEIEDQISVVSTGVSERDYRQLETTEFNLRKELENLVQPFVSLLLGATEEARRIEASRRSLTRAQQNLEDARIALSNIEAALKTDPDNSVAEELATRRALWLERVETNESQVAALTQQIDDLLSSRVTAGRQVQSALQGFFRERGLSLLLGVLAFISVLMGCRILARLMSRLWERGLRKRSFSTRLSALLFSAFTVAASFAAMLIVFNLRNDWLLLGLSTVLVIALIWIGIRMMPGLFEQVTVLLNLGAVQEDERLVFNGVPYKVRRLSFYSDLTNPALDGGEFTLPVRELIGLHSRPAAENEAWFPSLKGDWVRLADGNSGQVIVQTPEMVVVELLGGAQVTYQTADYLAQTPENLSHGFRVEIEFGIDYRHQADATGDVIDILTREVEIRMRRFVGAEDLRAVAVEFLRAGASSLDYEIEVDVTGAAAPRFEEIERELARVVVEIASENQWEIPFQQIMMHRAG